MNARSAARSIARPALLTLALWAAGCKAGKPGSGSSLELYERGEYEAAWRQASSAAGNKAGPAHEREALVAGMSAYELKRYDEAERRLRPLSVSGDRELSGRASATLGLGNVARNNFAAAAIDLSSAGRKLTGEEAARANFCAGECYTLIGKLDAARNAYNLAQAGSADASLRARASGRNAASAYAVQLGAFGDRANAERIAAGARPRAQSRGLPAPSVVQGADVGRSSLYLVQMGRYKTKDEAASARVRIGGDAVVVPVGN